MNCRICNNENLYRFLSMGDMPLANSFLEHSQLSSNEPRFPLNTCFCDKCGLVQLDYLVPPDLMFKNYIYFSSTSDLLQKHFLELAEEISRFLPENSLIVEIASNDGIVLRNFKKMGMRVLGIEPAANIAKYANEIGINTLNEYWSLELAKSLAEREKADVIVANNVIGHVHDLHDFAKGISLLLKDNGMAVIQVQYLVDLIENLEYDTIYHEHVSYISLTPIIQLFKLYGLHVFDVKRFSNIHGGSIRMYVSKNKDIKENVLNLLDYERQNGFLDRTKYHEFAKKVNGHRTRIISMLKTIKSEGKSIAGYGAAAKASVILNFCNINKNLVEYIADKSKYKQGLLMPGMRIPVVAPEKILEDMPDYVIILAWNFADEIMEQQKEYRKRGGKFIVPIPEPVIL